jgi:hypothetical protein
LYPKRDDMKTRTIVVGLIVLCTIIAMSGIVDGKASSSSKSSPKAQPPQIKKSVDIKKAPSVPAVDAKKKSTPTKPTAASPIRNTAIKSSKPKKMKIGGHDYDEVEYPASYVPMLLASGYVFLMYEDDGDAIYINNQTWQMAEVENDYATPVQESQPVTTGNQIMPQQEPGFESFLAIFGLVGIAGLVLRRN